MRIAFADSSFYIASLIPNDLSHALAVQWANNTELRMVTSEFVLLEVANFMSQPPQRSLFSTLLQRLRISPSTRLVRATGGLFNEATDLYEKRPDKSWSLVDCSSFVLMGRFKLKEALTADHHFEQAGFRALLR
jgi:uncharacterized protein